MKTTSLRLYVWWNILVKRKNRKPKWMIVLDELYDVCEKHNNEVAQRKQEYELTDYGYDKPYAPPIAKQEIERPGVPGELIPIVFKSRHFNDKENNN